MQYQKQSEQQKVSKDENLIKQKYENSLQVQQGDIIIQKPNVQYIKEKQSIYNILNTYEVLLYGPIDLITKFYQQQQETNQIYQNVMFGNDQKEQLNFSLSILNMELNVQNMGWTSDKNMKIQGYDVGQQSLRLELFDNTYNRLYHEHLNQQFREKKISDMQKQQIKGLEQNIVENTNRTYTIFKNKTNIIDFLQYLTIMQQGETNKPWQFYIKDQQWNFHSWDYLKEKRMRISLNKFSKYYSPQYFFRQQSINGTLDYTTKEFEFNYLNFQTSKINTQNQKQSSIKTKFKGDLVSYENPKKQQLVPCQIRDKESETFYKGQQLMKEVMNKIQVDTIQLTIFNIPTFQLYNYIELIDSPIEYFDGSWIIIEIENIFSVSQYFSLSNLVLSRFEIQGS